MPGAPLRNYSKNHKGDPHGPESGSFFDINRDGLVDWIVAHKNRDNETIRDTYLNTGSGWQLDNNFLFPNILVDNVSNEGNVPMHFGGLMDLNSDGAVDYLMSTKPLVGNDIVATYMGNAKPADMLVGVKDSLGSQTTINYKPMMDTTVYNFIEASSPAASYRTQKVIGPMQLVSDTWQSDGVGGDYHLQYFYFNALNDGIRGYLGFYQRHVWDPHQKVLSINRNYQRFPVIGASKESFVYKADDVNAIGNPIGNVESLHYKSNFVKAISSFTEQGGIAETQDQITQPSGKFTYAPKFRRIRSVEYGLGPGRIREIWTNTNYDDFSNPIYSTNVIVPNYVPYESIDLQNNFWTKTEIQYDNDTTNWLIGMPVETSVTHHSPGQPDQIRLTQTQYNSIGLPIKTIVEPNKPEFTVTTDHIYDVYGNEISTTVSGAEIESRISTVGYDAEGLHAISKTNALGHTASIIPDPICDAPKSATDANGLVTTTTYDQFCRVTRMDYPDDTWSTTDYLSSPLAITNRAKGQPDVTTYYDSLGRNIRIETVGFDGRTVIAEKQYNNKGQITHGSLPYYEGETKYWTQYYYDAIGRVFQIHAPDNSISSVDYNGLTTITTNPLGQTQTSMVDIIGRLKTVIDAQGNAINYEYDAVGNLLNTTDPMGNEVKMGYDHAGRKTWMDDPDMGYWTYEYDALGQLIKQIDSKGQEITTVYDKLGRMTQRTVQPGTTDEQISNWEYDTAANGIGLLDETNGPDGYQRRHTYDTLSRPKYTYEQIKGIQMTSSQFFNSDGKLREIRYPGRNSLGYPGHADRIKFAYNSTGYLSRVYNVHQLEDESVTEDLWVPLKMDAKGNITEERYGNGVSSRRTYNATRNYLENIHSFTGTGLYVSPPCPDGNNCPTGLIFDGEHVQNLSYSMDAIGNLTERSDHLMNAVETFSYDNLNRLTQSTTSPGDFNQSVYSVNYDYDVLGNLTYRSDVGIMNYGENGYGPHAITSIQQNQSANITENVFNPYGSYNYDPNGNLISNGQRTVTWAAFNKPEQMAAIIDGEARGVTYTYGSDFQRITKETLSGKVTRYYGGRSMEYIIDNGTKHWKYYIPVGNATLELKYEQSGNGISTSTYSQVEKQYLFKDHLGSTDVIVDNDGVIKEQLSFNPWGERRDADWTEADGEITSSTNRGFTGHEMDDEIGLINMNARIYDPIIGRFLSPDALIPSPTDLQSYNRYSYVRNNPLSFTDPTGSFRVIKKAVSGLSFSSVAVGTVKMVGGSSNNGSGLSSVPGKGGYKHGNGKYYAPYKKYECCFGRGDNYRWNTYYREVTDPGLINQLNARVGVAVEIINNYGGLSRGNAKETRNKYRALAAAELAANGNTAHYAHLSNLAAAANSIYMDLKRKARKRYTRAAFKLAAAILSGQALAGLELAGAQAAAASAAQTAILSEGDLKQALVAAATAGFVGPDILHDLEGIQSIAAHGVWGGISAEIVGGSFAEGFAGSAVGKAITLGSQSAFGIADGQFHMGQFAATVGGAALAAELAGGDPAMAALHAGTAYLYNQMSQDEYFYQDTTFISNEPYGTHNQKDNPRLINNPGLLPSDVNNFNPNYFFDKNHIRHPISELYNVPFDQLPKYFQNQRLGIPND